MRPTLIIAAGFAVLPILSAPAWAQANRTFVSGLGSDSNPCSLAAPCRSFAGALTQTNAGGEIVALDSAGYGLVTITKSMSFNAPDGIEAGVTVTAFVDGITVTVGASDVVNLRGLTLVGGGIGNNGILLNGLGTLNVQNCVIRGFNNAGLALEPTGTAQFNISDTIVSNDGQNAVEILPSGTGGVRASLTRVQAINSNDGFLIDGSGSTGSIDVTIADSTASNNPVIGIETASATSHANTQVMVVNTAVSNNGTGILETGANSTTYLAKNTIAGNTAALSVTNFGALFSFGDNYIKSNGNDGNPITLVATK